MKNQLFSILICLWAIGPLHSASAQRSKKAKAQTIEMATGSQDRELWVSSLYKIAYPVIHNLAEGTLRKNMALEVAPGYGLNVQKVTYLEAVGRTFAGVAPWLALPDDESAEGKLRRKIREEAVQGLKNAVDPSNPDCLNFTTKDQQPIVDAAYLVHAFLRAPQALWEPLGDVTQKRYLAGFKSLRNRTGAYNNWLLFAGITEAFLHKTGEESDPARINMARYKMKEWYVGDGWYSDGGKFSMDYYNDYVMHPMYVDMLGALLSMKRVSQKEYDEALRRMIRHADFSERQIAPDGTYPAYGRSVTYRTAAFQSLAQVALMEKLPEYISPAQVRCALTQVFRNMYEGDQNFDANGWLVLGFNGHQPDIADSYTSTGSLYMATLGFLPLGLPADNPFWTAEPSDWTSKKAWGGKKVRKDYKVEY